MRGDKANLIVGVYGLGRFGSFWADALEDYCTVLGYEPRQEDSSAADIEAEQRFFSACSIIFLCCPISAISAVSKHIAPLLPPDILVCDCCSIKVFPLQELEAQLPQNISILGTHPMFGPDSAVNGLANYPIVLSPVRISSQLLRRCKNLFLAMGLRVIEMTPAAHDKEAAFTQGLTHLLGRLLDGIGMRHTDIATDGYKALQKIVEQTCNDSWDLFLDLQAYNAYTEEMRLAFHGELDLIELQIRNMTKEI